MNSIIKISNLSKSYYTSKEEIQALKNISFEIKKGEFISIIGPSGCGKSTLLSIIGNLEDKTSGKITKESNLKIGYMFQTDTLLDWLNVLDNCLLGLSISKQLTNKTKQKAINYLNKYGLKEFIYAYPRQLSGGMRQRVALIRTLMLSPDIILLDEAFSALDYQSRLKVSNDVYTILKEENITTIMVTHDIAEAISMSDKVIVLSKRPATIKHIYPIKLENLSTPINNRKDKQFNYYFDLLWEELDKDE